MARAEPERMRPRETSRTVTLRDEVAGLLALEARLHGRVAAELAAAHAEPPVQELLRRLEPRIHAHEAELADVLARLHARVPVVRRALYATLGRVSHWVYPSRSASAAAGDLCDIYALLAAAAASYLVLAISARVLGDEQTLAVAELGADDANAFQEEIAMLLPDLARAEALGPGPPAAGAR
jgi:hypothetical protein